MDKENSVVEEKKNSEEIINELFGLVTDQDELVKFMSLDDETFSVVQKDILRSVSESYSQGGVMTGLVGTLPELAALSRVELEVSKVELVEAIKEMKVSDVKKQFLVDLVEITYQALLNAVYEAQRDKDAAPVEVYFEKVAPDAKLPTYAHDGDAGMDVYANEDYVINPGETVLVKTGIKVAIPKGYELQVRPRSGLSAKTKLRVANTPGTVDSGFRGEVCVIMENTEDQIQDVLWDDERKTISTVKGRTYNIDKGDRVAQLVLTRYCTASAVEISDVTVIGEDRQGGFGSTGK